MDVILNALLEMVVWIFVVQIYGTEKQPRHPLLRIGFRGLALSGAIILALELIFPNITTDFPLALKLLCGLVFVIFLFVEDAHGSRKIAVIGWAIALGLLGLFLWSEM